MSSKCLPRPSGIGRFGCALFFFIAIVGREAKSGEQTKNRASIDELKTPLILKPTNLNVGRRIPQLRLQNLDLSESELFVQDKRPLVICMFSATCPVSSKLGPELKRLEQDYQDFRFVFVDPIQSDGVKEIEEFRARNALTSSVCRDSSGALAQALQAQTTTEAFVLDSSQTLIYRGAINDQYGPGYSKPVPTRNYLKDALIDCREKRLPGIARTSAPGCLLEQPKTPATGTELTYNNQISRIIQRNCTECHRADGVAPFSLESYDLVVGHAGMIKRQVSQGLMPPWFAAPPSPTRPAWSHDRSLSEQDKNDLLAWLASNRPLGDPSELPQPQTWPQSGWLIGEPDVVLELPKAIQVKAEGTMPYTIVQVKTNFPEDRWIQAYEIVPTDKSVVHHALVSLLPADKADRKHGDESFGYWAAYVPGNSFQVFPPGVARKLPAGATLLFQIHYTPNGRETTDRMKLGLVCAKVPPEWEIKTSGIANTKLDIPPGKSDHVETLEVTLPQDRLVTGFLAHMHLRGKAFKLELVHPDGTAESLLDIPRYDFNWQYVYRPVVPTLLPKGGRLRETAVFDNSTDNPNNPDASRRVRWGQQTTDEMMIGYIDYLEPVTERK